MATGNVDINEMYDEDRGGLRGLYLCVITWHRGGGEGGQRVQGVQGL